MLTTTNQPTKRKLEKYCKSKLGRANAIIAVYLRTIFIKILCYSVLSYIDINIQRPVTFIVGHYTEVKAA